MHILKHQPLWSPFFAESVPDLSDRSRMKAGDEGDNCSNDSRSEFSKWFSFRCCFPGLVADEVALCEYETSCETSLGALLYKARVDACWRGL